MEGCESSRQSVENSEMSQKIAPFTAVIEKIEFRSPQVVEIQMKTPEGEEKQRWVALSVVRTRQLKVGMTVFVDEFSVIRTNSPT